MKHHPRDKRVKGVLLRQCSRCLERWHPADDAKRRAEKCTGREGRVK